MTPTLSNDAFQLSDTPVVEDPVTKMLPGAVGACVSGGQAAVDAVTLVFAERLPASSNASTANVYEVAQARPVSSWTSAWSA